LTRAKEANEGCERDAEEAKHGEQLYQNANGEDGCYVIDSKAGRSFGERQGSAHAVLTVVHADLQRFDEQIHHVWNHILRDSQV
jgi:hypothetical protein